MGLSFGFKPLDVRESIWRGDDALVGVPATALSAWEEDGDATHLQPYATAGEPSRITFRNLTPDESRMASAPFAEAASGYEGYVRSLLLCFRVGVDFPDAPEKFMDAKGAMQSRTVKERGVRMLSMGFVAHLDAMYPAGKSDVGIVAFYGALIHAASFPTESEKKASSPPSMPKPSSAEASTAVTTDPPPSAGAATGVP